MIFRSNIFRKWCNIILISLSFICYLILIFPGLRADEPFTISLIKHSYCHLIYIDSFDVHPPLYYLILKLYLQIFTFWTNNIVIKVIFARVFSFILFIFSFHFLIRILSMFHIRVTLPIQFILYFLFPSIANYALNIRMYQLAVFLLVIEIYELLKFSNGNNKSIIIACIVITMSFYVNYFTALFACSILFVEGVNYFVLRNKRNGIKTIIAGAISILLFTPCLKFAINQLIYVRSNKYSNFVGSTIIGNNVYSQLLGLFTGKGVNNIISIGFSLAILALEIFVFFNILNSKKKLYKIFIIKLILSFILGITPAIVISIINHPIIQWRYGFPMFAIIYFMMLASMNNKILSMTELSKLISFIYLCILIILNLKLDITTINNNVYSFNNICKEENIMNISHKKNIYNINNSSAVYVSTYLPINSHKIIITNDISTKKIFGRKNKFLFNKTFSNIHYS